MIIPRNVFQLIRASLDLLVHVRDVGFAWRDVRDGVDHQIRICKIKLESNFGYQDMILSYPKVDSNNGQCDTQCDHIWQYLKVIGNKFANKSSPNI